MNRRFSIARFSLSGTVRRMRHIERTDSLIAMACAIAPLTCSVEGTSGLAVHRLYSKETHPVPERLSQRRGDTAKNINAWNPLACTAPPRAATGFLVALSVS